MTTRSGSSWYAVLLDPVFDRVEAAWRRIPAGPVDPAAVPRAGLGGAVVIHVARGWGTRRWQEAGRVAVAVVEVVNQRVHLGAPEGDERSAWLAADLRVVLTTARRVVRRDEALLRRVAARLLDAPALGAARVPEAVIFLRGAIAAGVVAGAVPDDVHAALDRWAIALGTALAAAGPARAPQAHPAPPHPAAPALTAAGPPREPEAHPAPPHPAPPHPAPTALATAIAEARAALDPLPDCDARERLLAALDAVAPLDTVAVPDAVAPLDTFAVPDAVAAFDAVPPLDTVAVPDAVAPFDTFAVPDAVAAFDAVPPRAAALPDAVAALHALAAPGAALASSDDALAAPGAAPASSDDALPAPAAAPLPARDAAPASSDDALAAPGAVPAASDTACPPAGWEPIALPAAPAPTDPLGIAMDAALAGEGPLVEAARWLRARGGKRVRARMALGAARAVGGDPARALAAAAGVEWVHAASLVLDDIVDEAELRRGAAALHRATSTPFAAGVAGWLLVRTLLADRGDAGVDGLGETLLALAEGQRAELARAGDLAMSLDEWYGIATAKTARLFAHAATVGGAAVGATPAQQRALARYGEQIGLAFQIVDDLLDFVGDEGTLGKRPGQDLRAGRVTFPLLLLRDIAPALLASPSPDAIRAGLVRFGVPELCLARARAHRDRAVAALERLPGDPAELVALAHLCVERSA